MASGSAAASFELERARGHEAEARSARHRAACFERGDDGEAEVRALLDPLEALGWVLLHKRHWPGTRSGDIDHLLIGPGGVVVVDTKNWHGQVRLIDGALFQGQDDVTARLESVGRQVEAVEQVVATLGLSPLRVTGAMAFCGQDLPPTRSGRVHLLGSSHLLAWLGTRGQRLAADEVAGLAAQVAALVPAHHVPMRGVIPVTRRRPVPRQDDAQGALITVEALDMTELERAAGQDIETWMTYLHPAQLDVVRRRYSGPSRVRGPAGCGKTVVAMHRAAHLLQQEEGELVVVSFVRTLPAVLRTLYTRLSPETAHRVSFSSVHSLALDVLHRSGVPVRLEPARAQTLLNLAWLQVGRAGLGDSSLPLSYWIEEVRSVIKGRGLQEFEQYASLARTGRKTGISAAQRGHVWDLFVRYQSLLEDEGIHDFHDVVLLARDAALQGGGHRYRFVVVDEAQDLDLVQVQLLAALVTDSADGLTLVGDGQQSVYPGGYTLKEAGLSVTGRSTVLQVNYRNTRQVLEAATELVRLDDFEDLEGLAEPGDRRTDVLRDGDAVDHVRAASPSAVEAALLARLQADTAAGRLLGQSAILCRTRSEVARTHGLLRRGGLLTQDLEDYDGTPTDAVKVGTVKRAKGLEFARVYVPRVDAWTTGGDSEPEVAARERRELFVAMTRARDGLWCGHVEAG